MAVGSPTAQSYYIFRPKYIGSKLLLIDLEAEMLTRGKRCVDSSLKCL